MERLEELIEKLRMRKIKRDELLELKDIIQKRIDEFERLGQCERAQSEAVILGLVEGLLQKKNDV